jgi:DNA end-binding protein Ku
MAPRAYWKGHVRLSLVSFPVQLFTATASGSRIAFHQIHQPSGQRVRYQKTVPGVGAVDKDDIVKGYEVSRGKWVELTDDEMAAAAGSQSRRIEIDHFVPLDDVDPVYYERPYYLGAQDKGRDAYTLLHAALDRAGRAGVGRWVFHNRERTVLLRPLEDVLVIHTMRFADEVVDPGDFELGRVRRKPSDREIKMASSLVDGLHTDFDPSEYEDSYRADVLDLVERKAAGKNIELPADEEPEAADDLLAALEASLANA